MPSHLTLADSNETPSDETNLLREIFTPTTIENVRLNGQKIPSFNIDLYSLYAGALKLLALEAIHVLKFKPERADKTMITKIGSDGYILTIDDMNFTIDYRNALFKKGEVPIIDAYRKQHLQFDICFKKITEWLKNTLCNDPYSPISEGLFNADHFQNFADELSKIVSAQELELIIHANKMTHGTDCNSPLGKVPFGATRDHV